jgi:hypothetical protein
LIKKARIRRSGKIFRENSLDSKSLGYYFAKNIHAGSYYFELEGMSRKKEENYFLQKNVFSGD